MGITLWRRDLDTDTEPAEARWSIHENAPQSPRSHLEGRDGTIIVKKSFIAIYHENHSLQLYHDLFTHDYRLFITIFSKLS